MKNKPEDLSLNECEVISRHWDLISPEVRALYAVRIMALFKGLQNEAGILLEKLEEMQPPIFPNPITKADVDKAYRDGHDAGLNNAALKINALEAKIAELEAATKARAKRSAK